MQREDLTAHINNTLRTLDHSCNYEPYSETVTSEGKEAIS